MSEKNNKLTEPPKLVPITNVVADIEFTEHGASALCPNGSLVPLMHADGPVAVSAEQGHLKFGNVRYLRKLFPGQVVLVYRGDRFLFWTLQNWIRGAQVKIENHRAELARNAEEARLSQENSRKEGLRKRQRALAPQSRDTKPDSVLDSYGRWKMEVNHEQASAFGLQLGEVLDRELVAT